MSISEPLCSERRCIHFRMTAGDPDDPVSDNEITVCDAYPKGVPMRILDGTEPHFTVQPDQVGETIYTQGRDPALE